MKSKRLHVAYISFVTFIVVAVVSVYMAWWWHTSGSIPELVNARTVFYRDDIPIRAVLIWREELVHSRVRGSIQYRYGSSPAVVGKGDLVGTVLRGGKSFPIYSPGKGYFVPGLDGLEGEWRYSFIWPGSASLPDPPGTLFFQDLSEIRRDKVIGKLIPQPQNLRCVFYCPLTDSLSSDIGGGSVEFRLDPLGVPYRGEVRVAQRMGHTVKLYVNLPFFPADVLTRRELRIFVNGGEGRGVAVPDSAVVIRQGVRGVFVLDGNNVSFRGVEGFPVDGGRFMVEAGLNPGSLVLLNGMTAQEGRIKLW
ncbi:hypothetical protein L2W58_03015 [Dethiosulfovibrio sp. F2B]|uniref:efflux RND transporter periplasmic adaptor subunit n=1 Tax=Dethiosulfovibrio faecalis TaxID=2720018 RepID=UPI001F314E13|nr:efflux RND transporter periplasmic adaptor subunit [Dethiosulfovibrio faecalis]MCF4150762.1 hypothetical protein [Dethiosulfovibrio faecalis]